MSTEPGEQSEQEYILVANPGEQYDQDPLERYDENPLGTGNQVTQVYSGKIQPLSSGSGNYMMEIEEHWPNTDDVLVVNPQVLRPFIQEGYVAKVSRNIPVWINSEEESVNTVMDFPQEFHEEPMRYDIIIGSKPSSPGLNGSQNEKRSELEGEDVRVTNIESGSKPIIQAQAPIQQVASQLDPEDPAREELRELLEKDPEELGE